MDGPELAEAVYEISPQTPLLLLVDKVTYPLTGPIKSPELNGYIEKPFTSTQILQVVEQVMGQ